MPSASPLLEAAPRFLQVPLCFISLLFLLLDRCNFENQSSFSKSPTRRLFYGILAIGPVVAVAGSLGLAAVSLPQESPLSQWLYTAEQVALACSKFSLGLIIVHLIHPTTLRVLLVEFVPEVVSDAVLQFHLGIYSVILFASFVLSLVSALVGSRQLATFIPATLYLLASAFPIPLFLAIFMILPSKHPLGNTWALCVVAQTLGAIGAALGVASSIGNSLESYTLAESVCFVLEVGCFTTTFFVQTLFHLPADGLPMTAPPSRPASETATYRGALRGPSDDFRNLRDPFAPLPSPIRTMSPNRRPVMVTPRRKAKSKAKAVQSKRDSSHPLVDSPSSSYYAMRGPPASIFAGDPDEVFLTAIVLHSFEQADNLESEARRVPRDLPLRPCSRPDSDLTITLHNAGEGRSTPTPRRPHSGGVSPSAFPPSLRPTSPTSPYTATVAPLAPAFVKESPTEIRFHTSISSVLSLNPPHSFITAPDPPDDPSPSTPYTVSFSDVEGNDSPNYNGIPSWPTTPTAARAHASPVFVRDLFSEGMESPSYAERFRSESREKSSK